MTRISIDELRAHPANEEIYGDRPGKALIDSIKTQGILSPLLVTHDGLIVSGHRRWLAAKSLGQSSVPVVYSDLLDEDDLLEAVIESNRQRKKTKRMMAREAVELEGIARRKAEARQAETQFARADSTLICAPEEQISAVTLACDMQSEGAAEDEIAHAIRCAPDDPHFDLPPNGERGEQVSEPVPLLVTGPRDARNDVAEKLGVSSVTAQYAINVGKALRDLGKSEEPEDRQKKEEIEAVLEERGFRPAAALVAKPSIDTKSRELTMVQSGAGARVATLNRTNDKVDWAWWTWNPVTGCLHDCPYCYARDIANRYYPQKFVPTFHADKLRAPSNTHVPESNDPRSRRVFTCSMADLFGKWVPQEWIEAVFEEVRSCEEWEFLFLTKFPQRLAEIAWPENAWVGTTVDRQYRVEIAEKAFRGVRAGVKWLSCEPLLEPLKFSSLSMFDLVVIGGASRSTQTPEFWPPFDWVYDLVQQARECGCHVYLKPNALGDRTELPKEMPRNAVWKPQQQSLLLA